MLRCFFSLTQKHLIPQVVKFHTNSETLSFRCLRCNYIGENYNLQIEADMRKLSCALCMYVLSGFRKLDMKLL